MTARKRDVLRCRLGSDTPKSLFVCLRRQGTPDEGQVIAQSLVCRQREVGHQTDEMDSQANCAAACVNGINSRVLRDGKSHCSIVQEQRLTQDFFTIGAANTTTKERA